MATTTLVRLVNHVERELTQLHAGCPGRLRDARCRLVYMLLSATPATEILTGLPGSPVRGRRTHADSLAAYLAERSSLPEALCAHYRYGQSKARVLAYYRIRESDWRFVHRIVRDYGIDFENAVSMIPYEMLEWHDELEKRLVSVRVVLDPRALDDMLVCALEAYLSPRKRKGYEVYGITLGMCRDVPEERRSTGRMITRYVSMMRAQPQLSAVAGPRYVEPNYRSLEVVVKAAGTLFPQQQLIGDFHSHVFDGISDLRAHRGWEPSNGDIASSQQWIQSMRERGHTPQVDLIIAIARCRRRVPRSHFQGMAHTLQTAVGDCRAIVSAYRILQSGDYAADGVSLSVPGVFT